MGGPGTPVPWACSIDCRSTSWIISSSMAARSPPKLRIRVSTGTPAARAGARGDPGPSRDSRLAQDRAELVVPRRLGLDGGDSRDTTLQGQGKAREGDTEKRGW